MPKEWTLGEVILAARSEMGEVAETFITRQEIVRWINMGMQDFCARTRLLRTSATTTSVPGVKKYALPDDFGIAEKVFYDGKELEPLDDHQLLQDTDLTNLNLQGTPESYYMRGTAGSVVSLFLHPVPSGALQIEAWYVSIPDEVATDDKLVTQIVQAEYVPALIHYAAERGRMKQRMLSDAKVQRQYYEELVMRATARRGQWHLDRPLVVKDEMTWSAQTTRRTW